MNTCSNQEPTVDLDLNLVQELLETATGRQRQRFLAITQQRTRMFSPIALCGTDDMITISRFLAGATRRARRVTGDPSAMLFGWHDWQKSRGRLQRGQLSLTEPTFRAFQQALGQDRR
ncbi:MAG: hypothetical protein HQL37_06825 [Alphaproteobacteria bacterium]|nr:hypothetical protein [Alphaproteobacteria bacterium]